ncbi:MFS transporter [Rhodophyticola sp.]|uniref:MFS transporter n=1 Tax=Rhodophyticola sp. TaxID=2680032 RepID=UPI003D27127A
MSSTVLPRMALLAGLALMSMGQTVLFAIFGPLGRDMGMSEVMIGGVISLAAIAVVLTSPWWGRQVDRIGRRPVFLFAMAGLGVTTLVFALMLEAGRAGWIAGTGAFLLLGLSRIVYGLSVTGAQPAAIGWVADTTSAAERTGGMAMIGAAFGIGTILGPVLAWGLSGFGLLVPLYTVAALGGAVCLLAWRLLPETLVAAPIPPPPLRPLDPRLRATLGTLVVVFVVISALQQTIAFYVQDVGDLDNATTAANVGQALALLAAVIFVTQIFVANRKPAPGLIVRLGLGIAIVGPVVLLLWPGQPGILAAHALLGLGMGLVIPGLQGTASLSVTEDEQGAVGGLVGAAMAGGFVIGPVLGTGLYALWSGLPYLVASLLLLCALTIQVAARPSSRIRSHPL